MSKEEGIELEETTQPAAVVINTPSTGRKVIVQLNDELLIETELPFEEDFQANVTFLVDELIRLGERVPVKRRDLMIG